MKSPLSTKEMIETGILRFFRHFSKVNRKEERYKANKMGERAESWPTPMFILKIGEEKLFHR